MQVTKTTMGENVITSSQSLNENQDYVDLSYEEKLLTCNQISKPMSSKKQVAEILKLLKKAHETDKRNLVYAGMKSVTAKIRKGEKGIVIMAGDVQPIDKVCHLPGFCEEKDLPYIFVPSKYDIGTTLGLKGNALIALVLRNDAYEDLYDNVLKKIKRCQSLYDK